MTVSENVRKSLYTSPGATKDIDTLEDKVNMLAERDGIAETDQKVQLSCYVDAKLAKATKAFAHKTHQSMSSVVMKALEYYFQR
jgi:hypothetical protein